MLEYFRRVEETGEELVVTDNHIPVLKVIPFRRKLSPEEAFGDLRGIERPGSLPCEQHRRVLNLPYPRYHGPVDTSAASR
jgi:antitoxin (DNA-binding transcriptional repressor) of toxin-antitoxin stability system